MTKKVNLTITVCFKDGRRVKLKEPAELPGIDGNRKALFMFSDLSVYYGTTDGEVDEDGDFCIKSTTGRMIGMPYDRLRGWAYVD